MQRGVVIASRVDNPVGFKGRRDERRPLWSAVGTSPAGFQDGGRLRPGCVSDDIDVGLMADELVGATSQLPNPGPDAKGRPEGRRIAHEGRQATISASPPPARKGFVKRHAALREHPKWDGAWIPVLGELDDHGASSTTLIMVGCPLGAIAVSASFAFGGLLGFRGLWKRLAQSTLAGAGVLIFWFSGDHTRRTRSEQPE